MSTNYPETKQFRKERPILFSGPMVRAILEGRKTQTRRIIKGAAMEADLPSELQESYEIEGRLFVAPDQHWIVTEKPVRYAVGDRLWVRESFNVTWGSEALYKADGGSAYDAGYSSEPKWKPSIHMPRWASRITLEVTAVKVERLQDISEEDAQAEGAPVQFRTAIGQEVGPREYKIPNSHRGGFANLWNQINGSYAWELNPWVVAVTFKRVEA